MRALRGSWSFCNGGAKKEKLKDTIFCSKSPAIARICNKGTGFFIQRNLLLTTHANLPSLEAAEAEEIRLHSGVAASLVPRRFFISSSVLDLTIVGIDVMDENTQLQPLHYIKTSRKPNLDLGKAVYLLGYADENELVAGEGKLVIATDNLIKMSTDGITWSPGSAGFDIHGNLAFMVCDPMKLATSPNTKPSISSSSSLTSRMKDHPTQFGIPISVICDWLIQHWEGNLDDLNKLKLPLIRLVSGGQKADPSCASFTRRQVFKPTETEDEDTMTSRNLPPKFKEWSGRNQSSDDTLESRHEATDLVAVNLVQAISTPEIHELPKLRSIPVRENENAHFQSLDITIPPRSVKSPYSLQAAIRILQTPSANGVNESPIQLSPIEDRSSNEECPYSVADAYSTNGAQSEVHSNSSSVAIQEIDDYYSSEGDTTMYSAETAESRNYPSPKEGRLQQYVSRSQSCLNHNRYETPVKKTPAASRTALETQTNSMPGRKVYSQGVTTQRSNDYFSPTVSSIMKKRNSTELLRPRVSTEQPAKALSNAFPSSPRWIF